MGALAKFVRLAKGERALIVMAALTLAAVKAGLSLLSFATVRRLTKHGRVGGRRLLSAPRPSVEKISWAVEAMSRRIPSATNCLVRALATEYMLRRFGYPSELRIGVAKTEAGAITAHAWVESEGAVVIGEFELGRYVVLSGSNVGRSV